jgi:hypothetical protein
MNVIEIAPVMAIRRRMSLASLFSRRIVLHDAEGVARGFLADSKATEKGMPPGN